MHNNDSLSGGADLLLFLLNSLFNVLVFLHFGGKQLPSDSNQNVDKRKEVTSHVSLFAWVDKNICIRETGVLQKKMVLTVVAFFCSRPCSF